MKTNFNKKTVRDLHIDYVNIARSRTQDSFSLLSIFKCYDNEFMKDSS